MIAYIIYFYIHFYYILEKIKLLFIINLVLLSIENKCLVNSKEMYSINIGLHFIQSRRLTIDFD